MFETLLAAVVPVLLPGAGAIVTGLVSLALIAAKKYVKTKTDNALVENAMTRISHTVETVVSGLTQTAVEGFKEAAEDGKLSLGDAVSVKEKAMNMIMYQLPDVIKENAALGAKDLNLLISNKIEQAVARQKSGIIEAVGSTISTIQSVSGE
jgi:hypothetical protein